MDDRIDNSNKSEETTSRFRSSTVIGGLFVLIVSLLAVSALVVNSSIAAFSSSTSNSGNSFSTGTVDLVDNDVGAVMFSASNLVPGQSVTNCIVVTYQGTVADPAAVKFYSGGYTDSGTVGSYLTLTVEEGTGGTFGNCTGFTNQATIASGLTFAAFDTANVDYATGLGTWNPSSTPVSKTYRITVQLAPTAPDTQQGKSVTAMTFAWEVQS